MHRIVLMVSLSFLCFGCELTYEDNVRLLVKGTVILPDKQQVPELPIDVYAAGNFSGYPFIFAYGPSEDLDLMGTSNLNPNGEFNVTAISPENADEILMVINDQYRMEHNKDWPTVVFTQMEELDLKDYTYSIGPTPIKPIVESRLNIKRIENKTDSMYLSIRHNASFIRKNVIYDDGMNGQWPDRISTSLYPNVNQKTVVFRNIRHESIQVYFRLFNNGIKRETTLEIKFNQETNGYEIRI
ncbi:hypothetical protein GTQ34_06685 [Muricauda sp. JGD-17]|uniref:Uncharacterized protein n=1 Tax=Flagellimonas ochracea TaxID=2696472 RepID=A0A964WX83_9FLAO|nr:hypothetical protein [Allomuricauda ochracea]NAY91597.1 hypothetical protein [Allomuricauda ochracea]